MSVAPIPITLMSGDVALCKRIAQASATFTYSRIREEREPETRQIDHLIGALGNLAGCMWLYGRSMGHYVFNTTRHCFDHYQAAHLIGDGGSDIVGSNIDFKACEWDLSGPLPIELVFLPVRPGERHADSIYVLVLVAPTQDVAHIVGWLPDRELTGEPNGVGEFDGAHVVFSTALHEPMPIRWTL